MDVHERTAANRRLLADFFDGLDDEQFATRSLCEAWTVREVLGHLASPMFVGLGTLLRATLRAGGSIDRANAVVSAQIARKPVRELTDALRAKADLKVRAPGIGPMGQMTDGCMHLRDCARPLGLDTDVSLDDWRVVLDWLPTRQAGRGVVVKGALDGVRLRATDQDWHHGVGPEASGPSEALAMSLAGRKAALADLAGPGRDVLAEHLGRR